MSDRVCVLGCMVPSVHFATCGDFGLAEAAERAKAAGAEGVVYVPLCSGCVPASARDGVMICDRCYRRMRGHVDNAADLVGRLRSLGDPSSAMVYEDRSQARGNTVAGPGEPSPVDLIDAAEDVMRTLRQWAVYVDPRSGVLGGMPAGAGPMAAFDYARRCANVILSDFDHLANNQADITQLAEAVLTRHPVDEHGVRGFWSIVDAVSRYRLERPDAKLEWAQEEDREELAATGIPEWGIRLVTRKDAIRIVGSAWTLARWMKEEGLEPRAITYGPMGRVTWFRESDLIAIRDRMRTRVGGRPKKAATDA